MKDACEKLLEERDNLLRVTDDIDDRLVYFQELENATRMLNHPGESLVLQTDFLYMVERVNICIEYFKSHRNYREADIYLFRYQQCMTRAMTLIKMYFVGSFRALSLDVSRRLSEKDVSTTAQTHLLYTRFTTVSQQLVPLLAELERRARAYPQELSALLSECHSAYFSVRKSLLVSRITEEIRGLDPGRTELVELTRTGCSYLKQLCTDEFELCRKFFTSGEDQLYQYLENLCDYLYDDLRPRILHEPRLTALCEVCTVLQALMVLDTATIASDSDVEDSSGLSSPQHVTFPSELRIDLDDTSAFKGGLVLGKHLHISHLLQAILQDAQTRLFFKAQAVVQSEVRYYTPKPEDLRWPELLVDARRLPTAATSSGNEINEKESVSKMFGSRSMSRQETWYPTLAKTVWVLEQLRDFVKPAIFEDIAQEAINFCRQSLVSAADLIAQRTGNGLDGRLFLVRHLLILKEVGKNLDLDLAEATQGGTAGGKGTKGGTMEAIGHGVTDTLTSILSRTTSLLPDTLFASLGIPRAAESIQHAQHGIDHELRCACEAVISYCADPISKPLLEWADKMGSQAISIKSRSAALPTKTSQDKEPFLSLRMHPSSAIALEGEFRRVCETDLKAAIGRLKLYLEDEKTVRILVEHVAERAVSAYAGFAEVVRIVHSGSDEIDPPDLMSIGEVRTFLDQACQE